MTLALTLRVGSREVADAASDHPLGFGSEGGVTSANAVVETLLHKWAAWKAPPPGRQSSSRLLRCPLNRAPVEQLLPHIAGVGICRDVLFRDMCYREMVLSLVGAMGLWRRVCKDSITAHG
jgi:hypothetical protein